jgi:hypothetical protein
MAEASGTDARVYFIRKKYPPYIHAVPLSVNGTLLATLANDDYVAVTVPLGVNAVLVDAFDGEDLKFDLPVTSDPMYVLLTTDGYKMGIPYINTNPAFCLGVGGLQPEGLRDNPGRSPASGCRVRQAAGVNSGALDLTRRGALEQAIPWHRLPWSTMRAAITSEKSASSLRYRYRGHASLTYAAS